MKKISDVKVGDLIHSRRNGGPGVVTKVTKRTITAKFPKSICKLTYASSDSYFNESDF